MTIDPGPWPLSPSMGQRAYDAHWQARQPRRQWLTALGRTLVPCRLCGTVTAFAMCGLCSCEQVIAARNALD